MIIDATDLIAGRLASVVAKKALLGEKIDVINSGEAVITGTKEDVLARYKQKRARGDPRKGPFMYKKEDRFLRRLIRGMLPHRQHKGSVAFKRVMCYIGVPDKFKDKKAESIKDAHVSKMQNLKYIKVKEICRLM